MNSFSINRFWKTLQWVLSVNSRSLIGWTLGYSMIAFIGEQMFCSMNKGVVPKSIIGNISAFFTIFVYIAIGIGISLVVYDLNKKPRREAFLMLPASNLEKYLSLVFYWGVVWTIGVLVSFAVGDTLRMVFRSLAYGDEWLSAIPLVARNIAPECFTYPLLHTLGYRVMETLFFLISVVWLHSCYTFGGTLLRKYSFVITSVVLVVGIVIFGYTCKNYEIRMFYTNYANGVLVKEEVGAMTYILCVLLPIFSIFNYWLSFRIFKGFQLITNKWTNYDILKR